MPRFAIAATVVALVTLATTGAADVDERGTPPDAMQYFAPPVPVVSDDITPAEREALRRRANRNLARLRAERGGGSQSPPPAAAPSVSFAWPVRAASDYTEPGFYGISNFVDEDPTFDDNPNFKDPATIRDYMCGTRTYDTPSGYGHSGTDIFSYPFAWDMMDAGAVEVVAAAPGVIIDKADGNYDRNCSFAGTPANYVTIMHADGSRALYYHLRNGSVTAKNVGDPVALGEYLGTVGSSGNSTGPHLHFEVVDAQGLVQDPWQGPCNDRTPTSLWQEQQAYRVPSILRISTGVAPPVLYSFDCGAPEIPNERTAFHPGDAIFFIAYFRDLVNGGTWVQTIRRPDGTVFFTGTRDAGGISDVSIAQAAYDQFAPEGPTGTWHFEGTLGAQTVSAAFDLVRGPLPEPTVTPTPAPRPTVPVMETPTVMPTASLCGDADLNGTITVSDGVNVLRMAAGLPTLCTPTLCDVDDDGATTVTDGVNVLRAAAGLPATLACPP